ncbi:MAG: hybrid sensor histidine kinase/response regulator [Methanospirillaceae archaeon]|nr:hybrid sensor histidine kinase/response regulator [Methanospirillaceae archaeon]
MADTRDKTQTEEKKIVLVVEDSKTQAEQLVFFLLDAGYQVMVAANGVEALKKVTEVRPDLILTDILMPAMDGYELCRTIKTNPDTRPIPVILLTQLKDPIDVIRGLECEADNFIMKPYDEQYLLNRIEIIIANKYLQEGETMQIGIEIIFAGKKYYIPSSRFQILNILLSTYEVAVRKNQELQSLKEELLIANDQLSLINRELGDNVEELAAEVATRKKVEGELRLAYDKIHLMSSVTRHDMFNTLTALSGYHEIAYHEATDPAFVRYVTKERDQIGELTRLFHESSLFLKSAHSDMKWRPLPMIIQDIISNFSGSGLTFTVDIPDIVVYSDCLLDHVFTNIIDNAIRHGRSVSSILIRAVQSDTGVSIEIQDDGTGILENEREAIFTRGYGKNTGLGLYLIREILKLYQGTIHEAGSSQGARFVIDIPSDSIRNRTDWYPE